MATTDINPYIEERVASGVQPEQLRVDLLQAGWRLEDIDSAFNRTESPKQKRLLSLIKEAGIAGLLSAPLLCLPLLAGRGIYPGFWLQLTVVTLIGGLTDIVYCLTLRKFLTPVLHPSRIRMRWLAVGPLLTLLLLQPLHAPFALAAGIAVAVGLGASFVIGRSLVWDALASSVGFGSIYLLLYLWLGIQLSGPSALIPSYSGVGLLAHPIEEVILVFLFGAIWGPLAAALRLAPKPVAMYDRSHRLLKQLAIGIFLITCAGSAYATYDTFGILPTTVSSSPSANAESDSLTAPISITFDRPIQRRNLSVKLTPPIDGDLSFSNPYLQRTFVRSLTFTPKSHLQAGTAYKLEVTKLTNLLGRQPETILLAFHTPSLPMIASVSIADGQKNINVCDPITVTLDHAPTKLADFGFELTPSVPLQISASDNAKTYSLKPLTCLNQSTSYSLAVTRQLTIANEPRQTVQTVSFTSKGSPGISAFIPQGVGVLSNLKQISISFSEVMQTADPTQNLSIVPAVDGSWHWTDSRTLVYDLRSTLQLDMAYSITVKHGLKDARSGFLAADAVYSFHTVGHVQITGISPHYSGISIDTPIRLSFDQPVDHASAEQRFLLSPAVAGTFSWQGQTMLYSAGLSRDASYQITEAAGVISLIGLPLSAQASTSFQTEESVFALNIPVYYQQHNLSCEAASLSMALTYKGVLAGESSLLNSLGDDLTPRQGNVWGNPYAAFVGDVNGHQNTTGYGVYAGPVSAAGNLYRSAQVISGLGSAQAAGLIANGSPIVFWGTAGNARVDNWSTPAGRQINGYVGEHVRLLIGFTGPSSRPTGFIINDPIFGRLHWSASQLQGNMGAFNGMAVAIF